MIRKLTLAAVMLLSLTVIAAEPAQRDFNKIISSGELRIGASILPPWVMRAKDGQLIGAEIDMGRRLAADMGIKPTFGLYEWEQLIPALEKGEIDIIVSGMAIKPNRALRVSFSHPYGDGGIGLATNTQLTKDFTSLDAMKQPSIKIGVIADTVSSGVAKRLFSKAKIINFATEDEAQQALLAGKVHALVAANPLPKFLSLKYAGKIDAPLAKPMVSYKEGLAIKKGQFDFLNFLNAWVVAHSADGWIPSTRAYWLESLDWQEQVNK
jgi:polar amino acid transport system substrate-binding protein